MEFKIIYLRISYPPIKVCLFIMLKVNKYFIPFIYTAMTLYLI